MRQPTLFEGQLPDPGQDTVGKFHGPASGAPATERASAIAEFPRTGTKRLAVLEALVVAGSHGLTDYEGAKTTGIYLYTYAPRRVELVEYGWIEDSGRRRPAGSGKLAAVWRLSEQGRAEWVRRRAA